MIFTSAAVTTVAFSSEPVKAFFSCAPFGGLDFFPVPPLEEEREANVAPGDYFCLLRKATQASYDRSPPRDTDFSSVAGKMSSLVTELGW